MASRVGEGLVKGELQRGIVESGTRVSLNRVNCRFGYPGCPGIGLECASKQVIRKLGNLEFLVCLLIESANGRSKAQFLISERICEFECTEKGG